MKINSSSNQESFVKKQTLFFLFAALLVVLSSPSVMASTVNIDEFGVYVRPKDGANLIPSTGFTYQFDFSTDQACTNVLTSKTTTIVTDKYGVGFVNLDITDLVGGVVPNYLCEYRDGTLRATHTLNNNLFREISGAGSADWNNITNIPADIADGDDDTTYTAGTGIDLTGTVFSLDLSYLNNNFVGQNEYPNLDTDSTDDITGVVAGDGLSGGASSGSASLAVNAGDGIVILSDQVAVDTSLVPYLADDEIVTGSWTFNDDLTINANLNVVGSTVNLTVQQQIVNGSILPDINGAFSVGSPTSEWSAVYANSFVGSLDFSNLTNVPSGLLDGDDDTTYTAGTGISLIGTEFAVDTTYLDSNYVGQNEYPNLDTDSTDDLTTSTIFTGDVTGTGSNLLLVTGSVGDEEINYSQVTLADLTNDAGFITGYTETDPLFAVENSTLARTGTCPSGQFVVNVTTGGVDCASAVTGGDNEGINASGGDYLFDDGSTVFFNETRLNATITLLDTDTQLNESQVDAFVANNGYLTFNDTSGWDTNASDDFSGSWNDLTSVPAGFADGIDNDTTYSNLSEFINDVGYITGYTETDPLFIAENSTLARIGTCPSGEFVVNTTTNGVQCATPIDTTDGQGLNATNGLYLFDDGSVVFFNETQLNNTISALDTNTVYSNGTGLLLIGNTFSIDGNYFSGWDQNASDDFSGDWNDLINVPAGFADGIDNDTTYSNLSEFINDVGYITGYTETDPLFTAWNYNWNNLTNVPTGFADGIDNDTQYSNLSEFSNDVGYITLANTTGWDTNASDDFSGNWSDLTNVPTGFADGIDNNTQYTSGTGIVLTGTIFSIDTTYLDTNYVEQNEYPNLDIDSTDDLTTSTAFVGDVSGLYNNLQLGIDVVSDSEIDYSTVTLNDFTNDAGYITGYNETDPLFTAWNYNWNNLTNVPAGFSDGVDNDTQYSAGTGILLNNTVFSLDTGFFTGWDTNASNDLTLATSFSGDVSGTYNNLLLGADVVGDNEINYTEVTLGDFTNDAQYIQNNTAANLTTLDVQQNANVAGNVTVTGADSCVVLDNGGKICGELAPNGKECTIIYSPDGNNEVRVCNN